METLKTRENTNIGPQSLNKPFGHDIVDVRLFLYMLLFPDIQSRAKCAWLTEESVPQSTTTNSNFKVVSFHFIQSETHEHFYYKTTINGIWVINSSLWNLKRKRSLGRSDAWRKTRTKRKWINALKKKGKHNNNFNGTTHHGIVAANQQDWELERFAHSS